MTETESVSSAKALFIFLIKTSHTTICHTDLMSALRKAERGQFVHVCCC